MTVGVDGTYRITLRSPTGTQRLTLEVATTGSTMQGKLTGAMGALGVEGTVDGNRVTWAVPATASSSLAYDCTATIEGDSIRGEADMGALGTAPFSGARVDPDTGRSAVDDEPAIPWTDLGKPRYEALSVKWVDALREYLVEKVRGTPLGFEVTWSVEYTGPPEHLLRGDGRDTVGYHIRVADGVLAVVDGPLAAGDDDSLYAVHPYDPSALALRMRTDGYVEWLTHNRALLDGRVTMTGDVAKAKPLLDLMAGPDNDIREEFFSQQTA